MSKSTIPRLTRQVMDLTSGKFSCTITNPELGEDAPATLSIIQSITLDCYVDDEGNAEDGEIVNSREEQNVLNANDGTMHATSGLFTFMYQPEDTEIQDDTLESREFEVHIFRFRWVLTNGHTNGHELELMVEKTRVVGV